MPRWSPGRTRWTFPSRELPVDHEFDPLARSSCATRTPCWRRSIRAPVFYAPSLDYYVVTRYADVERGVPRSGDVTRRPTRSCRSSRSRPRRARSSLDGGHRPQPSMVSLDPPAHTRLRKPAARAFTPRRVAAMEPRIRATTASCSTRSTRASRSTSSRRSRSRCRRAIIFTFMGVPEHDWPQLKEWCGSRATLAWGRPAPEEQVEHARKMAAYRRYLRELVAAKADDRGDDFASALLEIHDEDPEALTPRGDRLDPVLAQLRRPRDDEQPDRQPRPPAARGPVALGGDRRRPGADPRRRRRDAALRHLGAGVAAGHHAAGDARRRRPARGREALPVARGRRAATPTCSPTRARSTPRARTPGATSRSARASTSASARASASSRRGSRSRRSRAAARGCASRGPEIPFHPNISFRGPMELWVTVPT